MNIKRFNSASRKAALAAVAFGVVGFGASATAMADTGAVSPAPTATAAQLISPAQPATPATAGCERITFTVLHNDRTGGVKLPQGPYVVWSNGMSCKAASADFTNFLNHHQGAIPGWTGQQEAPGYGNYTNNATGQSFSVGHMADQ
jgi:hypothetical protein